MKLYAIPLVAAILFCSGCGQERKEAVTFCQTLKQKDVDMAATNLLEKDLMRGTRDWCDGIVASGAGRGAKLDENAATAKVLAESASVVSGQLSTLRQAIYDQPLKQDYPQSVRSNILKELMERQKRLQTLRSDLQAAAAGFLGFRDSRAYKGDSYPAEIGKLANMLGNYGGPIDPLAKAIEDMKATYELKDADLGAPVTPRKTT
jgi:hypothetical protein